MMGMDCLRVSKFMEAKKWFEKAIKEHIDDYRPQLAMAILYLEQSKPEQALSFLKKALSLSVNTYQKRHIYLLIARLYETSGTLPYAQREIEQVRSLFHDWNDARYYLGVIFAKSGKIVTIRFASIVFPIIMKSFVFITVTQAEHFTNFIVA
jgi:Tfp pilus assembly protein PilF